MFFKKKSLKEIKEKYEDELLAKKNVIGVGIAPKISNGEKTDELCISVMVKEKVDVEELSEEDVIPEKYEDRFQTDVVETGEITTINTWKEKKRPLRVGASMCNEGGTACSQGLPVFRGKEKWVLNNNHCSQPDNDNAGDKILQPSPHDGGKESDCVAKATEYFFPVSPENEDNIDTAADKVEEDIDVELKDVAGIEYEPKTRYIKEEDILKEIKGGGRTIGKTTRGQIHAIDSTINVKSHDGTISKHKDCVVALNTDLDSEDGKIVKAGDSSSVRFVDNKPLLQTFAGSDKSAVFLQTKKALDYYKEEYGLEFSLSPQPKKRTGYVAWGSWINVLPETLETEKIVAQISSWFGLNLRERPTTDSKKIKTLRRKDRVEFIEYSGKNNGYKWSKVKEAE